MHRSIVRSAPPASIDPVLRLVATDLDGTLLDSSGGVSARTRAALAAAEAAGTTVVFVTARPIRWVDDLRDLLGAHGVVLCGNGAVVYDVRRREVLESSPLPSASALAAVRAIRGAVPDAAFARESLDGFAKEGGFVERGPVPDGSPVGPIEQVLGDRVVKLLVRSEVLAPEVLLERVTTAVGARATVSASSSTALAELSAPGVTKAETLERFARARGIERTEVVAFGDMLNDLPMLAWAGRSVAVANAHPLVLEQADGMTGSNDDDGVAQELERLLAAPGQKPSEVNSGRRPEAMPPSTVAS